MAFGPWGALIGGVLGAGASLMDKGTRDAVGKFVGGMWDSFMKSLGSIGQWLAKIGTSIMNKFKEIGDGLMSAIKNGAAFMANALLDSITLIPRTFVGIASFLASQIPDWVKIPGLGTIKQSIKFTDKLLNTRFPVNFASGLNYSGSALALEERLSGGRAFIANSNEVVIPRALMGGLTDNIEQKVRRSMASEHVPHPKIELVININRPLMLGENKELIDSLRKPVIDIMNEAYKKNVESVRTRPKFIT